MVKIRDNVMHNRPTHRRTNVTQLSSSVASASAVCIGLHLDGLV